MKLRTILVEDEATSREILRGYLTKYCPNVEILGEADGVDAALQLIRKHDLDLVFLDVEMPYGNAFDLLEKVGDRKFETVFVTAYDHYAIDALNHHASYYLLKPISIDELIKAVDYVVEIKEKEETLQDGVTLSRKFDSDRITIPTSDGFEIINTAEIVYCQADDNYTEIHLENGSKLVSKTLKHFEDLLKDKGFCRIHKSHVINVSKVQQYKKGKGGSVFMTSGKELLVSSNKKADFLSYFK